MKKILLIVVMMLMTVASFGHKRVSETATVVGDTIYYAANHMSVNNASEASYYRLLMTQGVGVHKENVFKDYYMDGTLRAEGGYSFIDLGNDKNTVYNGDITTYYQNGKEKMRGTYVNGQREGYFTLQLRNGGVATVRYKDGQSAYDYFVVTMPDGTQSKHKLSEIRGLLQ